MTAHELARHLLNCPDLPVAVWTTSWGITSLNPITNTAEYYSNYKKQNVIRLISNSDDAFEYM